MQKYKCKLGFHHVRDGQEEQDLLVYLSKKPLVWTLNGSGLFYFPVPSTYNHYAFPARTAASGRNKPIGVMVNTPPPPKTGG